MAEGFMPQWDCFISHVSEDKKEIVEPLAEKLRAMGLKVWVDNQEIKIGDSLRQKIEQGLANSRFGIVILSPTFLERASFWSQQDLNALMAKEEGGHTVILPVWHGITKPELIKVSPILADRLGANSKDGLEILAANLARVILHPESGSPSAKSPSPVRLTQNLIDSHASGDTMFEFIKDKPQIMDFIAGWDGHKKCAAVQVPGTKHKGFLCWTGGCVARDHGTDGQPSLREPDDPMPVGTGLPAGDHIALRTREGRELPVAGRQRVRSGNSEEQDFRRPVAVLLRLRLVRQGRVEQGGHFLADVRNDFGGSGKEGRRDFCREQGCRGETGRTDRMIWLRVSAGIVRHWQRHAERGKLVPESGMQDGPYGFGVERCFSKKSTSGLDGRNLSRFSIRRAKVPASTQSMPSEKSKTHSSENSPD
jgi:hypothetical protein